MITLCGFAVSNYYNKVKLVLLEKGIPFTEEMVMTNSKNEAVLSASPLGKVPFIRTPEGTLCESSVIAEYLEELQPQPALLPGSALQRGKVRELCTFVDLHLELVVRELYAQAFFGGTVSEGTQARVKRQLEKNIPAFQRLAQFGPYVAGDTFTLADCAAAVHLPLVGSASKLIYGRDCLADLPVRDYLKRLGERPTVQAVNDARKANTELMLKRAKG
jgi:glutathione S-transferase